jgi:hypothetical protein
MNIRDVATTQAMMKICVIIMKVDLTLQEIGNTIRTRTNKRNMGTKATSIIIDTTNHHMTKMK